MKRIGITSEKQTNRFGTPSTKTRRLSEFVGRILLRATTLCAATFLFCGCNRLQAGFDAFAKAFLANVAESSSELEESVDETPRVDYCVVQTERVPLVRATPGRVAAIQVAQVRPQVNGIVKKQLFEEGAFVNEGDVLYEIDSSVYRAAFEKARANLESLTRRRDRAEKLMDRQATSEEEFEDSHYAFKQAEADYELAALELDYCQIKAPISGKVGISSITVGSLVTNGQESDLTTIQQVDPIFVDVNPSVAFLQQSKRFGAKDFLIDAKVEILLEGGAKYELPGKIVRSDNEVQPDVGTVALRAEFPNPNGSLLPGMFVRAFIEEGILENGITLPRRALFRDPKGRPYVWIVRDDSTIERRMIQSERVVDGKALVEAGLNAGDRVVVEGSQYISDGTSVRAVEYRDGAETGAME